MMLLYRFNILHDVHKLRMEVILVLYNWRIKDGLSWTIRTKACLINAAYIPIVIPHAISGVCNSVSTHVVIIIAFHSNYPLPVLKYNLLYSQKDDAACTLDMEGDGLPFYYDIRGERFTSRAIAWLGNEGDKHAVLLSMFQAPFDLLRLFSGLFKLLMD